MKTPVRWFLYLLGTAAAMALFVAAPARAQSSSQSDSSSSSTPSHWGWYTPKPVPAHATQTPAAGAPPGQPPSKPEPARQTVTEGGATPGGRPAVTSTVSRSGGGSGGDTTSQRVSVPGINGGTRDLVDQETQTVRLNDHTTRTIEKIYGQDASGKRQLIAVQQTDTTDLGKGKSQSESTYSQRNADGNFDVTRSEVSDTAPNGPHSTVTNTTIFRPGMSGALDPYQKVQEIQNTGDKTQKTDRTVSQRDVNGAWATNTKTVTVVKDLGNDRKTEDMTLYAPDANGNLTPAKRVVTDDWKSKNGQEHQDVSTYTPVGGESLGSGGAALTLSSRDSTVKTFKKDGTVETQEQTQQLSLGNPSQGLVITGSVEEVDTPTKSGAMATRRTVSTDNGNGQLQQVTAFSGQAPQPASAPAAKPAAAKKPEKKAPAPKEKILTPQGQ